jgi:hypothetical protein
MGRPKAGKKRDTSAASLSRHSREPDAVEPPPEPKRRAKPRPAYKAAVEALNAEDDDVASALVAEKRSNQKDADFGSPLSVIQEEINLEGIRSGTLYH